MMFRATVAAVCLCGMLSTGSEAAFGGKPPLGPTDNLRRELAPYDLPQLNYLGMNYCENLLDMRLNITSYSHLGFDSNSADAWHLQFPDDSARLLEGVAWEADYSSIARVEFARRLTKGLIAAHVPGTKGYTFFRHRNGGKTYLILGGDEKSGDGRVTLSNWGDALDGILKVGFRAQRHGKWLEMDGFTHTDEPNGIGSSGVARSPYYWNLSPVTFTRRFANDSTAVDFTGRYWMSDEDMPLEYRFSSRDADRIEIVVGEPGRPMPILSDANAPGIIHMPDRTTTFRSDTSGDKTFERPAFNYMILRKQASWAAPGYSSALLIMWDGRPERIHAVAANGYGEIRIGYAKSKGEAAGKVWLYPVHVTNHMDMEYLYRNAESFLRGGRFIQNGFPSNQMINAIPAGLAAGAYMLTKYNDPMAPTARICAQNAVDQIFEADRNGMRFMRAFFSVRAATWMLKTAKLLGDGKMAAKYTEALDGAMKHLLSSDVGYDGNGWPWGWDHFNATKSVWFAYDTTGKPDYKAAWERAIKVYTIDENGIYRNGQKLESPGGFDTYSGSMPLGVWGSAGMMEECEKLINLEALTSPDSKITLKEMWNDSGAGPWAQDDANPEYVGLSLKGLDIPQGHKRIMPVGAFPVYDASGNAYASWQPIVHNPFFLPGPRKVKVLESGALPSLGVKTETLKPGTEAERASMPHLVGKVENGLRIVTGTDGALVYEFDTPGADGAGVDMKIEGRGFTIDVSPDGRRWYRRLDTWSEEMSEQSLDVSFLTGSHEELVNILSFAPGADGRFLFDAGGSTIKRSNCRYAAEGKAFTYRLDLKDVVECHLEMFLGNAYQAQHSPDGRRWTGAIAPEPLRAGNKPVADAAWIRMLDVTPSLNPSGEVYIRIADEGDRGAFEDHTAFLRRLTAYGAFRSGKVYVRISNTSTASDRAFSLGSITLRTWKSGQ